MAVLVEFLNVEKNLLFKYKSAPNPRAYFADRQLTRAGTLHLRGVVHLLYDVVKPGSKYLHDNVIRAVDLKNQDMAALLLPILVLFIFLNVCAMLFIWLPYIRHKRSVVLSLSHL
jgi:hypothetical protein